MKLSILGTDYTVSKKAYSEDPDFAKSNISGYCDSTLKKIVICDMKTFPGFEEESKEYLLITEQDVLRHEIVHAFLNECGLRECAMQPIRAWSKNEEMVDWIALIGPKIYRAWQQAGAVPNTL